MSTNKIPVTVTYASVGARPPVFLAGSFSEPAWHPQEMSYSSISESGELHFHKEVEVYEGKEYQYKFRIGHGEWWALNENAPTVTDELGNRNNLLVVSSAKKLVDNSVAVLSNAAPQMSNMASPEVVVEKVDGHNATADQAGVHDMRAVDAEPRLILIRSQIDTSLGARTAAVVADSAALLDKEPSPAPISQEKAGRDDERYDSNDRDVHGDMSESLPQAQHPFDTSLGQSSPSVERETLFPDEMLGSADDLRIPLLPNEMLESADDLRVPLLPHEILGSDESIETHIDLDNIQSPTRTPHEMLGCDEDAPIPLFPHEMLGSNGLAVQRTNLNNLPSPGIAELRGEDIDFNDPTIEHFPVDRMGIMSYIRSAESRLRSDETVGYGASPSPVNRSRSRSSSNDTSGSPRSDSRPSAGLEVITEEYLEEDASSHGLTGPGQKFPGAAKAALTKDLNVVSGSEESTNSVEPDVHAQRLVKGQRIPEAMANLSAVALENTHADSDNKHDSNLPSFRVDAETGNESNLPLIDPKMKNEDSKKQRAPETSNTATEESNLKNGVDGVKIKSVGGGSQNNGQRSSPPELGYEAGPSGMDIPPAHPASAYPPEDDLTFCQFCLEDVEWLRGCVMGVCGLNRGQLLVGAAVVILGPLLAVYLYKSGRF